MFRVYLLTILTLCGLFLLTGGVRAAPFLFSGALQGPVETCAFERTGVATVVNPVHTVTADGSKHCFIDVNGITADVTFLVSACNLRGCSAKAPCALPSGVPSVPANWQLLQVLP